MKQSYTKTIRRDSLASDRHRKSEDLHTQKTNTITTPVKPCTRSLSHHAQSNHQGRRRTRAIHPGRSHHQTTWKNQYSPLLNRPRPATTRPAGASLPVCNPQLIRTRMLVVRVGTRAVVANAMEILAMAAVAVLAAMVVRGPSRR